MVFKGFFGYDVDFGMFVYDVVKVWELLVQVGYL